MSRNEPCQAISQFSASYVAIGKEEFSSLMMDSDNNHSLKAIHPSHRINSTQVVWLRCDTVTRYTVLVLRHTLSVLSSPELIFTAVNRNFTMLNFLRPKQVSVILCVRNRLLSQIVLGELSPVLLELSCDSEWHS
jgi:hypothetical protein